MSDVSTLSLPDEFARQIGVVPPLDGEAAPVPTCLSDWAWHWASRGLYVFPAEQFLGRPLIDNWYGHATASVEKLVAWWTDHPKADIAAVPERSGHFVIRLAGDEGRDGFADLEERYGCFAPDFSYRNRWGDEHLWFRGNALSRRCGLVAPGVEVIGRGRFVYLPPSLAPDPE